MPAPPYNTIVVSGDDAFDFLQAQLATDLQLLAASAEAGPVLSAWCSPKGRVICLFRVRRDGDDFALALPDELTDEVVKRLTMFRFRAKVEFDTRDSSVAELDMQSSYDEWRLANLHGGIPEILAQQSEEWTPHMLNLDLLSAVSVDKGCYPGQEIVSRTHYRGKTKRRLLRFESAQPVAVGDKVSDGERDIGEVVNAIGNDLLAVVSVDKLDRELTANDARLVNCPLPYL